MELLLDTMPKKELVPLPSPKPRIVSRRAASKEALKQMHLILDDEAETLEIPDDDDVIPVDFPTPSPPKKKYKLSHRKSSDGDREVLVLKTIRNHNVENSLDLECWHEDLSPEQQAKYNTGKNEEQEIQKQLSALIKSSNAEVIYKGNLSTVIEVTENIQKTLQGIANSNLVVNNNTAPTTSYQLVVDPRMGLIMSPNPAPTPTSVQSNVQKSFQGKVKVAQDLQSIVVSPSTPSMRGRKSRRGGIIRTPVVQHAPPPKPTAPAPAPTPTPPNTSNTRKAKLYILPDYSKQSKCAVWGCNKPVPPFYAFPIDETLRKKWVSACARPNINDIKNPKVCHKHFSENVVGVLDRLAYYAIPVKDLPSANRSETSINQSPKVSNRIEPPIQDVKATGNHVKPTENNVEGGLSMGSKSVNKNVVDLTTAEGRIAPDSREVAFNKIQGKTYPSLVVLARPHLRVAEQNSDRTTLDAKVKSVLMHPPTKFTEWLIQQGLVRSQQKCTFHPQNSLKLGMYSDVTSFPYSGGYVWISECCPQRFVSVFSGSLFEGSPHPPMVILKLLYHWACQTNIQNVTQWVKVDNLYVKSVFTWLRAICTVGLYTHVRQLGGPGIKVEVGVISLGTTSQDGIQRQVKVEVLGILETTTKYVRLRAVEPVADGDRNYKKRFMKILEPIMQWVHPMSIIVTDLTVDKNTLHQMGFQHVVQSYTNEYGCHNRTIMEYLRRIVPRMFQNTLSLLSRQIIQQFLDELVWREWFGTNASQAFDNLLVHISEQTRFDSVQSLIIRLNKVALNPFKSWAITIPGSSSTVIPLKTYESSAKKGRARKPEVTKAVTVSLEVSRPPKPSSPDIQEHLVPVESYYYGTIDRSLPTAKVTLNIKCPFCKQVFTNNLQLMNHLFKHAPNVSMDAQLCRYCLTTVPTANELLKHIAMSHPNETKFDNGFVCLICETQYMNPFILGKHMAKEHCPSELPYQCNTCGFRCSNHKLAIDHFYRSHNGGSTIQCPFCLKSTTVFTSSRNIVQNVNFFIQHLQKHQRKQFAKRCGKCNLWFIAKDIMKEHQRCMHVSQRGKPGLVPWTAPRNGVMVPKSNFDKLPSSSIDFNSLTIIAPNNAKCKECNTPMKSSKHYQTFENCRNSNCQYGTCCRIAISEHCAKCNKSDGSQSAKGQLPQEMFCVCGFSSTDGNILATHLALCERKSAYSSTEDAKSACVTKSMLDVLGLIRKPDETEKKKDIKTDVPTTTKIVLDDEEGTIEKPPEKIESRKGKKRKDIEKLDNKKKDEKKIKSSEDDASTGNDDLQKAEETSKVQDSVSETIATEPDAQKPNIDNKETSNTVTSNLTEIESTEPMETIEPLIEEDIESEKNETTDANINEEESSSTEEKENTEQSTDVELQNNVAATDSIVVIETHESKSGDEVMETD